MACVARVCSVELKKHQNGYLNLTECVCVQRAFDEQPIQFAVNIILLRISCIQHQQKL